MADFAAARLNMVESQVRPADVTDVRLHDAMRTLARESFLPPAKAYLAYADIEVEYAPGRSLLKPRDVAKLLQSVRPMPGERALAIAAPYAAAILEQLGLSVSTSSAARAPWATRPPPGPLRSARAAGWWWSNAMGRSARPASIRAPRTASAAGRFLTPRRRS
jgi:hypothetical protein